MYSPIVSSESDVCSLNLATKEAFNFVEISNNTDLGVDLSVTTEDNSFTNLICILFYS
jgi:hypothetical protein